MMQGIPPLSTYSSIQKIKIIILTNRINTLIKNPWAEAIPSKKKKKILYRNIFENEPVLLCSGVLN
jgi:hypothetical protein